jgi:membrane-associated phospholipid phosphatase
VCGPVFVFADFPAAQQRVPVHPIPVDAIPNGIPSVHVSTALLMLWFLREWPIGRAIGLIYLALTIGATLGIGQHYFFDLLCAVPYTFAILRMSQRVLAGRTQPQAAQSELPAYAMEG